MLSSWKQKQKQQRIFFTDFGIWDEIGGFLVAMEMVTLFPWQQLVTLCCCSPCNVLSWNLKTPFSHLPFSEGNWWLDILVQNIALSVNLSFCIKFWFPYNMQTLSHSVINDIESSFRMTSFRMIDIFPWAGSTFFFFFASLGHLLLTDHLTWKEWQNSE